MPGESALLSVRDLSLHRRDGVAVLSGLSFEVFPGEILGIVGESGSGKSQLLLSLLGLAMPGAVLRGSARLQDTELVGADEPTLRSVRGRRIAMLFQDPLLSWNPCLTIGAQLAEVLKVHGGVHGPAALEQVNQALAAVELADSGNLLRRYPHELSGGMRQRAMLAMAVLSSPQLLLADEPTTALDPTTQRRVLRHLKSLRDGSRLSIVLVTHDLGVIAEVADRVIVLDRGLIAEQADTAALLRAPVSPYARRLLDSARQLEGLPCLP